MNDSQLEQIALVQFKIIDSFCHKSVRIYHLIVKENDSFDTYSFFFRHTTLFNIHNMAQKKPEFPKGLVFPKKFFCFYKRKNDRTNEFIRYFKAFRCFKHEEMNENNDKITNISHFLKTMSLHSAIMDKELMDFHLCEKIRINNPFLFEVEPIQELLESEYPALRNILDIQKLEAKIQNSLISESLPNRSQEYTNDLSTFTNEKIKITFKKEDNKIDFLTFLDEKIINFSHKYSENSDLAIPHIKYFRILLIKLKLTIIHKILLQIDKMPQEGKIWQLDSELKAFLTTHKEFRDKYLNYLNDSVKLIKILQKDIFEEKIKNDRKNDVCLNNDVNAILSFINPKIDNWNDFQRLFKSFFAPIHSSLKKYMKEKIYNVILDNTEENSLKISQDVFMLYKNLAILRNGHNIFKEMSEEQAKTLGLKKYDEYDRIDYRSLLSRLDFDI